MKAFLDELLMPCLGRIRLFSVAFHALRMPDISE